MPTNNQDPFAHNLLLPELRFRKLLRDFWWFMAIVMMLAFGLGATVLYILVHFISKFW